MASKVVLKLKGLYSAINNIGSVPDGALRVANNIVIDKEDIGEIRRGFKLFGSPIGDSGSNTAKQLLQYKDRIFRHYKPDTDEGYLEYQDTVGATGFSEVLGLKMLFSSSLTTTGTDAIFETETPHGLLVGDEILIEGAAPTGYNGTFTVSEILSDTEFKYDVGSSLSANTGNAVLFESTVNDLLQPEEDIRIKSVESNGNLYITTQKGVKKLDNFNSTMLDAGAPRGLDITLDLFNNPGFFEQETQVGYRVVWGIRDANDNLILGSPSQRAFISNPGKDLLISDYNTFIGTLTGEASITGTYDTVGANETLDGIKVAINSSITELNMEVALTGNYGVYSITGDATLDLLQETYDDIIDVLISETAITGTYELARTSQQVDLTITIPPGITESHFYQIYRTSNSLDLTVLPNEDYQLVYEANPTLAEIKQGTLNIIDITPEGFRGAELYTNPNQEGEAQANSLPPFALDIELYNGILFYANTRTRHQLDFSLVGLDPLTSGLSTLVVNNGSESFTINFSSSGEDASTGTVLLDLDSTKTVSQRVESTARSLVKVMNRYSQNTIIFAYYLSGPNDVPGQILLEARDLTDGPFTLLATNSTTSIGGNQISAYSPSLVTAENSSNEEKPNRVYYSKIQEPEAVPALNYLNVGGGDNQIKRIKALRDGLFIFTEEGVFKVTGDTPSTLFLSPFDTTVSIKAPEALAKGNNKIYIFTDEGICQVSDAGVEVISYQIEDKLLPLLNPEYTNFNKATFGTFYQSDRKYMFFTLTETDDEFATQCFIYNVFTNTWVIWPISKTAALVNEADDKLYLAASDTNSLEQERKNFDYTDHADREHEVTIIDHSRRITSISTGTGSVVITANNHGLSNRDVIKIQDTNSTPELNGNYRISFIDNNTFSINETVTVAGTEGIWSVIESKEEVPVKLKLNTLTDVSVGDSIYQELTSTVGAISYTYSLESNVISINLDEDTVTIDKPVLFELGEATIFDFIEVEIEWSPQHAGDPSVLKHFRELHIMFDKFRGSDFSIEVGSDIQVSKDPVTFDLNVKGNWGLFGWGQQPWGGNANVKNLRTYIPVPKQKARQLDITFKHSRAREKWRMEGMALFFRLLGVPERTNRG